MFLSRWRYYLRSIPTVLWHITPRLRILTVFLGFPRTAPFPIVLRNGLRFIVRNALDIWIIKESCLDRVYEYGTRSLPRAPVIIDIGAGLGDFSISVAQCNPQGVVYAYEPDAGSFALLQTNIARNHCTNIWVYHQAVTGHGQPVFMNRHFASPVLYQTCTSDTGAGCDQPVLSSTLNDIFATHQIRQCDLLKIDCEGAEYDLLFHTSSQTLARICTIALEYHDGGIPEQRQSLVTFLEQQSFRVQCVPSPVHGTQGLLYAENVRCESQQGRNARATTGNIRWSPPV